MYNIWLEIKTSKLYTTDSEGNQVGIWTSEGYESGNTEHRFKTTGNGANEMSMVSLWGSSDPVVAVAAIKAATHSTTVAIGCWETFTGVQEAGITYDETMCLTHMPDVSDEGDPPIISPATIVTDTIIVFGQELRDF